MWTRATAKEAELETREERITTREMECGLTSAREPIKVGATLTMGPNPLALAKAYYRAHELSQGGPDVPIGRPDDDNPTPPGNANSPERFGATSLTRAVDIGYRTRSRSRRGSRVVQQ
jgi:hypothetical protein